MATIYRIIWPARALADIGYDVEIRWPGEANSLRAYHNASGEVKSTNVPADADVVVLQRPANQFHPRMVRYLRGKGVAVVVDVDDDLAAIDPTNLAWSSLHPSNGSISWHHVVESCRDATLVTVSTQALVRRYGRPGSARVLDNYVPAAYLSVEHEDSPVVGWGGTVMTHPTDLQATQGALGRLARAGELEFHQVGPVDEVAAALGLPEDPKATGTVEFEQWPHALAQLGIGIAPLADSRFNQAKSRIKALDMAAVGVPWVGSPRAEYARLHYELGTGLLAERGRHWERALRELIRSESRRRELSQAGRSVAASQTIEAHAWRWMEVWDEALRIQRG